MTNTKSDDTMTDEAHLPWTEKHAPTSFNKLQGNNAAVDRLKDWAKSFPDDRQPRLLEGPPGVGKSTVAELIADWLDLQMVELNASSARKKDDVAQMAKSIGNRNADGERKLILLDEADSWHAGTNLTPLYDALDRPGNPVIITVNDKWETPSGIVSRSDHESFSLSQRSRMAKLKKIRDAEDMDISDSLLERLAERPDLRSAINDLQVYADLDDIPADQRAWSMSEWDMVDAVMTGTPNLGGERPRDGISPGEALMWLDENVSADYRGLELAWAYEALRRADVAMMKNYEMAQEMIRSVAHLRITEPYYEDEISRKKKSFPEWFRHTAPDASGGSDEAKLYRALSNYDNGEPGLSQSFVRFRRVSLPELQALPAEEKYRLILHHRLSPEEYAALDVQQTEYENWVEEEKPTEGDWGGTTEPADAW